MIDSVIKLVSVFMVRYLGMKFCGTNGVRECDVVILTELCKILLDGLVRQSHS